MLLCGCSRLPFTLATCIYYLLLISGLFTLALAGDIAFFFTAFTILCSTHVTLSGMVRSNNTIREAKDGHEPGDTWGTTVRNKDEELKTFWESIVLREYRIGDYTRRL